MTSTGPSTRAVCRVVNRRSCGSGSIVGYLDRKPLILTNAHVAGTSLGRECRIDVESVRQRIAARVIMAAYSDRTLSDWAILHGTEEWREVEPVFLSKKMPTGSHYTKGFPRCEPHNGTDITTVDIADESPLWRWKPNAISGQSGSGVWSDSDHNQYGLLTWSWGGYGAGQTTAMIYIQAKNRSTVGFPRIDGLEELVLRDIDMTIVDRDGLDDPIVRNGFYSEVSIVELPIWAEDQQQPPVDPEPEDPSLRRLQRLLAEYAREKAELEIKYQRLLEGFESNPDAGKHPDGEENPGDSSPGTIFGL